MKNVLAGLLIVLVAFYACKPNYENENEFVLENAPLQPRVRGDMFHFENESDLKLFYNYLVEECERRDTSQIPFTEDWLLLFDCAYGIDSRLKVDYNAFETFNTGNREEEDWLIDEYRKTLLNEDFEISIGDYVYVYLSENQVYKVLSSDAFSLEILRQSPKGNDNLTPVGLKRENVELISDIKGLSNGTSRGGGGGGGLSCEFTPNADTAIVPCQPLARRVFLSLKKVRTFNGNVENPVLHFADWIVDWGDGSQSSGSGIELVLIHQYSAFGSYPIKVSYGYTDCAGVTWPEMYDPDLDVTVTLVDRVCEDIERHKTAHAELGNIRMTYHLWVKSDMFGQHQVAKTQRYRYESGLFSDYRWRRDADYVKAEINFSFRKKSDCTQGINSFGLETDWGNWSYDQRAGQTKSNEWRGWREGEVHSLHEVYANPNNIIRTLYISPCD